MRIIPVIDLMKGIVVHGQMGERKKYKPIKSVLCHSADPLTVAYAFEDKLQLKELYIADLDAISHHDYSNLKEILKIKQNTLLNLMLDCGIRSMDDILNVISTNIDHIIIATETLSGLSELEIIVDQVNGSKLILSIDTMDNKILASSKEIIQLNPRSIAEYGLELGIQECIVLDLSKVGSERGPNITIAKEIVDNVDISVITGGGIRYIDDIHFLEENGFAGVLIATALHNGNITRNDLLTVNGDKKS
ncbi:HisA/HisF-related TIM barrel protein [Candidatus Borrarchaeum sp.]|uniref:HisA/HisF-related TIM barrel protein n=1 Tax=Candidatus Borrarchaeum sp. TaxID=2846742 RepID=UPI00257D2A40|nr:HisA/HisF-related TIM barrel protein [Candidatus Borrarchaeum sp.]